MADLLAKTLKQRRTIQPFRPTIRRGIADPVVAVNRPPFIAAPGDMKPPATPLNPQASGPIINLLRDLVSMSIVECNAIAKTSEPKHTSTMSTVELKNYVNERTPEERRWLARYLWETDRQHDASALAEFDRRMDEMDAGKNSLSWADASGALDKLDRQGK